MPQHRTGGYHPRPEQICCGQNRCLARRTGGVAPFMMTGGVARNRGVVKELETALKAPVEVSEYSQLCGSLGERCLRWKNGREAVKPPVRKVLALSRTFVVH